MKNKITFNIIERKLILFTGDLLIFIPVLIFFRYVVIRADFIEKFTYIFYALVLLSFFIITYILDLYNLERSSKTRSIFTLSIIAGLFFSLNCFFTATYLSNVRISRAYLLGFIIIVPSIFVIWRSIYAQIMVYKPFQKNTLYVYNDKENINRKIELIQGERFTNGYKVRLKLFVDDYKTISEDSVLWKSLDHINAVILDTHDYKKLSNNLEKYIIKAMLSGKEVRTFLSFYERTYEAIPIELEKNTLYEALQLKNHKWANLQVLFSKIIDFLLCLFVGIVFVFVTPFVYILNLFFNKGPLFYTQKRVGKRGEEFDVYKFRSMVINAEKQGAKMAVKNDSRITSFGKILRKFRIDELPQIISVIKGDMSFIGPRPERKVFVDQLNKMTPFYNVRHLIKPGITGWAQVKYKYGENLEDSINKLEYDLYYIKNRSITLDIRIIFKTITTVLFSRGV